MESPPEAFARAVKSVVQRVGLEEVICQFGGPAGLVDDMITNPPERAIDHPKFHLLVDNREEAIRIVGGILGMM